MDGVARTEAVGGGGGAHRLKKKGSVYRRFRNWKTLEFPFPYPLAQPTWPPFSSSPVAPARAQRRYQPPLQLLDPPASVAIAELSLL